MLDKIRKMTDGKFKGLLRSCGFRPKHYNSGVEDAFRVAMGRLAQSVENGEEAASNAFRSNPLPVFAKYDSAEIANIIKKAAIRETSIGGVVSLIDAILSSGNQSSSDRESAKLIQDYMIQYGY